MEPDQVQCRPAPGSPYERLPEPLRETLIRSFQAKCDGAPGQAWTLPNGDRLAPEHETHWNLANAWWGGANPKDIWSTLDACGPQWINLLVCIYERIHRIDPSLGLWRQIKYIRNGWWGGSAGFKVVYENPARMREYLSGLLHNTNGPRIARDTYWGGLEHQLEPALKNGLEGAWETVKGHGRTPRLPDCDTFREVDRPGEEGLHFCVGKHDLRGTPEAVGPHTEALGGRHLDLDDIHLDWSSPVEGIDGDHCDYNNVFSTAMHWMQAKLGLGKPIFCFEDISALIGEGERYMRSYSYALELTDNLLQFKQMWQIRAMDLAAQGKIGRAYAIPLHRRAEELVSKLREGREPPPEGLESE